MFEAQLLLASPSMPRTVNVFRNLQGQVQASSVFVQHMKTKWGSCNPSRCTIRLNTDLAKKPPECLEYIVVHELAHLIEPSHNARFVSVMNLFMPRWQLYRDELNRLPVRHEDWDY